MQKKKKPTTETAFLPSAILSQNQSSIPLLQNDSPFSKPLKERQKIKSKKIPITIIIKVIIIVTIMAIIAIIIMLVTTVIIVINNNNKSSGNNDGKNKNKNENDNNTSNHNSNKNSKTANHIKQRRFQVKKTMNG